MDAQEECSKAHSRQIAGSGTPPASRPLRLRSAGKEKEKRRDGFKDRKGRQRETREVRGWLRH